MGLGDCPNCWNRDCTCEDGYNWMRHSLKGLKEIRASIDAAIARMESARKESE